MAEPVPLSRGTRIAITAYGTVDTLETTISTIKGEKR